MTVEKKDFLVELGTEELPPTALRGLELAFASGVQAGLAKAGLLHGDILSFATPRRLAVRVDRLVSRQPDQDIKRRGPPVSASFDAAGQPTRAASAFAESCGVAVDALQKLDEGKGSFLFYIGTKPGAAATELLPAIVQASLDALPIPRRMHWGSGTAEFVRPVHWLVMLYGKDVLPARLLETDAGNLTQGHRFHAPKPIRISSPAAYESTLSERGYVLPDFLKRRELIKTQVVEVATSLGGHALIGDELLDEVTALVEWPVPVAGRFEERFLQLPREVLISTLQDHQRYFALEDGQGRLMPSFITVSNIESRDPSKVREGNERVVRPRLADAAFFWEQDRKQSLAARIEALDAMTFQVKLGSLGDKTRRVRALAGEIAATGVGDRAEAERAADLCKCDLLTAMVGEFPELQGIMGTYYALADGEPAEVAVAIREHYLPRGAGDELPETHAGLAVAIADKLDTLAGIFEIGEKPTGAKDPFGLRRAAIGLLRILIEKRLNLDLRKLIGVALGNVRADVDRIRAAKATASAAASMRAAGAGAATDSSRTPVALAAGSAGVGAPATAPGAAPKAAPAAGASASRGSAASAPAAEDQLYDFIMERLRAYYLERATTGAPMPGSSPVFTTEMFDAVLATKPASPLDFDARLKALRAFLDLPEATSLAAANKRIANILRKAGETRHEAVDVETLKDPAEVRLFDAMRSLQEAVATALAQREYANALGRLAQLRPPVDAFFEEVMVMDEDPRLRKNRLALLAQLHGLFIGIADLSRLPG
ncbi:MAG: glycyl-tRNA synthetase beta chain [Gammaproteobacteria bacterium]|jgi:glycyl-tRNA synthetase beta chain|nr:glycyl-tRNA synthetase beta chain [Gammaproteobacteria bacterium]